MTALAFRPVTPVRGCVPSSRRTWDTGTCPLRAQSSRGGELVERGHVTADDFKAFTHDNALALWGDEMFADTVTAAR
jgi:hypothetical protein